MALSKTHQDYWLSKLKKRKTKVKNGSKYESPDWHVRISVDSNPEWFNLGSSNQKIAANQAKKIWIFLQANGGAATLEQFKLKKKPTPKKDRTTVGEYIETVRELNLVSNQLTFETYCRKFRTLIAGAMSIESNNSKCDYVNGGYDKWKKKVESVHLDELTINKIQQWMARDLRQAGATPIQQKKRKTSQNSILRNSKSLFGKKIIKHISLNLPSPLPFSEVNLYRQPKSRYHSNIDAQELAKAAQEDLNIVVPGITLKRGEKGCRQNIIEHENAKSKREQFKILLLALGSGLRRKEIDTLQWDQLNFTKNTITLEENEVAGLKSDDSSAIIDVDQTTMKTLKSLSPKDGTYVIESDVEPRIGKRYQHYRCHRHFNRLILWLREKGVRQRNAIHTLRKEFGTMACEQFGIYIASEMLRHSNIAITREHYLDRKEKTSVKIL